MMFLSKGKTLHMWFNLVFLNIFQLFGDGSSTIKLNDGLNRVEIEVVAEDGTIKKYCVDITRLSAKVAELSNLALEGDIPLHPAFCTKIYEYNSEYGLHMAQSVALKLKFNILISKEIKYTDTLFVLKHKHKQNWTKNSNVQ